MLKILKWTFAILSFLIGAAVIGLVIFISQFDLNEYKPQIEKLVYDQTGRKLELKGDIGIKISLVPTLETKDVVLENAAWAGKKAMVEIKEADVTLGILPLLNKKVEIEEINIIEPVVNLSMNTDGTGNWVFEKPAGEEAQENKEQSSENPQNAEIKEKPSKSVDAAAAPLLAGFVAKKLYIENGVLNYEDLK